MTLARLARAFGKASVLTRDVNALRRGRLVARLANRFTGRLLSWVGRRLWFR